MTQPKPVQAYALVSDRNGQVYMHSISQRKNERGYCYDGEWQDPHSFPVTILPTEQYEAMVGAVERAVPLMRDQIEVLVNSHTVIATGEIDKDAAPYVQSWVDALREFNAALAALKEQDHG